VENKKFIISQSFLNTLLDAIGTSIPKKYTPNDVMVMADTVNKLPEYKEPEADELVN
jgi:hypothetical protein